MRYLHFCDDVTKGELFGAAAINQITLKLLEGDLIGGFVSAVIGAVLLHCVVRKVDQRFG